MARQAHLRHDGRDPANPDGITQYNFVPGLMGVILTMTMIMMTSLGVTREVERGIMENLLATPVRPVEVMVGKIAPHILIGYVQVAVILLAARYVFNVPFEGSFFLLMVCLLVFIFANLAVGITISSIARTQTQAMHMTFFAFLPPMLLSGVMFPFRGMVMWPAMTRRKTRQGAQRDKHRSSIIPARSFAFLCVLRVKKHLFPFARTVCEIANSLARLPNAWPVAAGRSRPVPSAAIEIAEPCHVVPFQA